MYKILNVLHYLCVILTGMMAYIVVENPNDEEAMLFFALAIATAIGYRYGYLYVKKEREESENEYEDEEEGVDFVNTPISRIKAEAYKEFAEKIKEKTKWLFSSVSINDEIDNLLNELVGDIKEKKKNNK